MAKRKPSNHGKHVEPPATSLALAASLAAKSMGYILANWWFQPSTLAHKIGSLPQAGMNTQIQKLSETTT